MNGLNLDSFLRLLRADLGAWATLGVVALILAVMTWTTWGSRRALRKCLILSIAVHLGLIAYGSRSPAVLRALRLVTTDRKSPTPLGRVRVVPVVARPKSPTGSDGRPVRVVSTWDRDKGSLAMAEPARPAAPPAPLPAPSPSRSQPTPVRPEPVTPDLAAPAPPPVEAAPPVEPKVPEPPPSVAPGDPSEVAPAPSPAEDGSPAAPNPSPIPGLPGEADLRARSRPAGSRPPDRPTDLPPPTARETASLPPATPDLVPPIPDPPQSPTSPRPIEDAPVVAQEDADSRPSIAPAPAPASIPSPDDTLPGAEVRRAPRPSRDSVAGPLTAPPRRLADGSAPPAMALATPSGPPSLPISPRPVGRRSLAEVPPVYRSRLDPNRTSTAQRAGASAASELAVERALDWLARHQDLDGRWDGGTSRYKDGGVAGNDDSFTIHCPAGEVCFGECYYPEADTALTGLSLLAYLGAGYTHLDGKYARTVGNGLAFLQQSQKDDGDLRGPSLAVGMYCHSMATLALCEAYALTGDPKLRDPVERAVAFLVRARSANGMAWRYSPGAPDSDTSILGWAVMALKSAKTVGIPIPGPTQAGILEWLGKVAQGSEGGLARYQPGEKVTPTMTAEAWACRQFLEVGGPGPASDEAAAFLAQHPTDGGGEFNAYYLYYGTLAMYQHGGNAWSTWNARVRDQVVGRQKLQGHAAGSWDPDDSRYGTKGGRIYGTALATLTLEVYYRFLRLYEPAPAVPIAPRPADPAIRRSGSGPSPPGR